ncbi:DUF6541 family protein [Microbacterium sp. BK668]|uniref:DUF6541 family protein n=1 Tax=Microbacterium sp. BK668 TaxID=2512118 RepID=UPI00105B548F|nr:DUF6541 family protein [Microbacterium sp. BK668]TDN88387.1 hypothetical protein EV279_2829 [Microbacterium sp. BK668]
MSAEWLPAVPPFLLAAGLLIVPGLAVRLVGWNVRAVGPYLFVPAVSVAIVAVASNLAPVLRMPWSLLPVGLVTLLAVVGAWALRRWVGAETVPRPGVTTVVAAAGGLLLAAVILCWQLTTAFVAPGNVSQTFDNIVHLNSIRLALDTANSSAFQIGATSDIGFYPNAWHSVVTLTAQLSGAAVPVAVNAANLAIGGILWPASCMALAVAFFGPRRTALLASAALSTAFGAFPVLLMSFGVLYPNATGYAVVPAGLAAIWLLLAARGAAQRTRAAVLLLVVCAAIGLGHPNAFLALFALGTCMTLAQLIVVALTERSRRVWIVNGSIALVLLAVGAALWKFARTDPLMAQWGPWTGTWQAIGEGLLVSPRSFTPTIVASVLVLAGLVAAAMRPKRLVFVVPFAVALFMFVLVSGTGYSFIRDAVTNPWYNDSFRLAALLPIAGIPVATLGAIAVVDAARAVTVRYRVPRAVVGGLAAVATVALFSVGFGPNAMTTVAWARSSYVLDGGSALLTADEMRLLERLDQSTPDDALILGNPWTGTSLALAIAGRDVVERHIFSARTPDELYLDEHLRDIGDDPAVCDAVRSVGADYVLDFGSQNVFNNPGSGTDRAGLNDLSPSGSLVLVDSEGERARLFRIEGC